MPDSRLRKIELFSDLGYEPHEGQMRVHRSKARHRTVACGVRWGKSTLGAYESIAELLTPRGDALGWLVAPTFELTRRIFERVVMVLEQHLKHRVLRHSPREHEIAVVNLGGGISILKAKSADSRVNLLGEALDWVVVDEAAQLSTAMWDEHISSRLIDRNGRSLVLSTPLPGGGWFYESFKRGQKGRDSESESWRSPSWENPHINRDVVEAERSRLVPATFQQQYEAKFHDVPRVPCGSCGGPQADAVGKLDAPVGKHEDDFIPRCRECGMFTDATGRCIVRFHNVWYSTFEVDRDWSDPVSASMYSWHALDANGQWF